MTLLKSGRNIDFTKGPILSSILLFALPLIATGFLNLLFNTADSIVVGRFGGDTPEEREAALGAVGSCGSLITLLVNLFMGLATGAGICVAQELGARSFEDVEKTVHTSVLASLVCGVFAGIIGFLVAEPLLVLMGSPESVLAEAIPYIRAYFCGIPASIVFNFCAAMLRASGDTVRPLIFLSTGGVINVFANLVMVIVFRMGALGVGIATALSQWISCVLVLIFMVRSDGPCRVCFGKLHIDGQKLRRLVAVGLPTGIQGSFFSISNVLTQSAINSFGATVVAGCSASGNLEGYVYVAQNAFYQAAITATGQNTGAKDFRRAKKLLFSCLMLVTVVGFSLGALLVFFGPLLLGLYAPGNEAVVAAALPRLAIICLPYFICGWQEVFSGTLRGLGKAITPTVVCLLGICGLRVLWIYAVLPYFNTPEMLYLVWPVTWIPTAAVLFFFCVRALNRHSLEQDSFVPHEKAF